MDASTYRARPLGGGWLRQSALISKAFHRLRGAYSRAYPRPERRKRPPTAAPAARLGRVRAQAPPPSRPARTEAGGGKSEAGTIAGAGCVELALRYSRRI